MKLYSLLNMHNGGNPAVIMLHLYKMKNRENDVLMVIEVKESQFLAIENIKLKE